MLRLISLGVVAALVPLTAAAQTTDDQAVAAPQATDDEACEAFLFPPFISLPV